MTIVITDGYALNPGDISWDSIKALGEVIIYDRTNADELYERCNDADIILSNKTEIRLDTIKRLPQLRMISVLATGYNVVDVNAASHHGVVVSNVPAYGTASVAQHAIALLLTLTNHVDVHAKSVLDGEWQRSPDWSYSKTPLIELAGKTLGIVGLGNIGEQTARIASALGMKVMYHNRNKRDTDIADYVDMEDLFRLSDFISIHCPLTSDNHAFVNDNLLRLMKPSAFLINTARGQLINEVHLADALNASRIAGAALDVLSKEPPAADNPLLKAKNCIITPHIAWMTKEARERIINITAENIRSFLAGKPVNVVN